MGFDPKEIRKDFPILSRKVRGKPLVYLDNAATTQKPESVIEALRHYYRTTNANVHRGIHTLSEEATSQVEEARANLARFINAGHPSCVIFTRNATEAINLVMYSWARKFLKAQDEVLLTEMEHHSNLVPWHLLAKERGVALKFIPVTDEGLLDMEAARRLLSPRTKLVSFSGMSNVLGTINPVKELVKLAHEQGAKVLVDGAQWVPHLKTDVKDLDCDFLAFSAHKMLGPTGIGVLYGKKEILESMDPFIGGGDMIREVWLDRSTYNDLPYKFEAGTPHIAGAIAFGKAVEYLEEAGPENIRRHELELTRYALELLSKEPELTLYGPGNASEKGGVISFNLNGIHPHDVGTVLDTQGVAIRAGHHCCQPLMRRLGVSGTARASFYLYNTQEEVDSLLAAIRKAKEFFKVGV